MIGGSGRDRLYGGNGTDLLIGGATSFDQDPVALRMLMSEWSSNRSHAARVSNLRNGTGPVLTAELRLEAGATVFDDNATDYLFGGRRQDWVFADLDRLDRDDDRVFGPTFGDTLDRL
ncbi:MAG: hypothetical protein O3A00_25685 [Planctomycetota bacterium]|nr:hypothetical protein [Planctomycetota bacterium]